jgi:hypothetical protein
MKADSLADLVNMAAGLGTTPQQDGLRTPDHSSLAFLGSGPAFLSQRWLRIGD